MKKLSSILLALVLAISCSISAYATNLVQVYPEDVPVQPRTFSNSPSTGVYIGENAKTDFAGDAEKQEQIKSAITPFAAATWSHLPGTYYIYAQNSDDSCGVATAVSAIRYLGGNYDWATVAKGTGYKAGSGTDFLKLVPYVNSVQSENNYILYKKADLTQSTLNSRLYSGVNTFHAPPLLACAFSASSGWMYSTNGYGLTVSGSMSDYSKSMICDPWIGYKNLQPSWSYEQTNTRIYNATLAMAY